MSPLMMLLVFVGVFVGAFGVLVLVAQLVAKRKALLEGAAPEEDGSLPEPLPVGAEAGPEAVLARKLRLAGMHLEPAIWRKRARFAAYGGGVVGFAMGGVGPGGLLFGLLLGFGVWKGSAFYLGWRTKRRLAEFTDQLSDALGVMANGVKAGQTIPQALEGVSNDFEAPLGPEVTEVLSELRMGVPLDEALGRWNDRTPSEDLDIATTALIVQRQTGGNVAEILDTLASTIRQRAKLHRQIMALTATGRMSGLVMASLPVGMFLAMYLIAPGRTGLLLTHPLGLVMTGMGVGGISLGAYFINRIVSIEI